MTINEIFTTEGASDLSEHIERLKIIEAECFSVEKELVNLRQRLLDVQDRVHGLHSQADDLDNPVVDARIGELDSRLRHFADPI